MLACLACCVWDGVGERVDGQVSVCLCELSNALAKTESRVNTIYLARMAKKGLLRSGVCRFQFAPNLELLEG